MDENKREETRETAETTAAGGPPAEGVLAKAARTIGSVVAAVTRKTGLAGKTKPAAPAKKTPEKSSRPATQKAAAPARKSGSGKKSGKKSGGKHR